MSAADNLFIRRGQAVDPSTVPRPKPRWRSLVSGWNAVASGAFAVAIGISLWQVIRVERAQSSHEVAVVRLAHWQLELGYRDALQQVIDSYNALQDQRLERGETAQRVRVEQLPVSEKTYGQLINTHLIAGTAPDIIELGKAGMISSAYRAQFFQNLSTEIDRPNPYNAAEFLGADVDSALAARMPSMSWRDTFLDGLSGGFDRELQGYYGIPTTFTPWNRYAVNLDLLKEATGSDRPPRTLGEFLTVCEQMRELGRRTGRDLFPVAGSSYSAGFYNNYIVPFMAEAQAHLDADHDGTVTSFESMHGLRIGAWSFDQPAFGNLIDAVAAVTRYFPSGFQGMDREGALLMFTQGQSGFFYCGSWDAGTIYRLTRGKFRVGIIVAGLPAAGESWGPLRGVNEASMKAECAYGINKTGAHVDIATDFLKYWTSLDQNQRFNRLADFVPCIIGSKLAPQMAAFAPQTEGYANGSAWLFTWGSGGHLSTVFDGKMLSVMSGRGTREEVVTAMKQACADPHYGIDAVIAQALDDARTGERNCERGIATQALAGLLAPDAAAPVRNYTILVTSQAQQLNGRAPMASMQCLETSTKEPRSPASVHIPSEATR